MRASSLPLERVHGRWTVAVGRARVDVADGAMGKPEAAEVARRLVGAGLVRGVHLASTKPAIVVTTAVKTSCGGCLDCLSCEIAAMRKGRRRGAH